MSFLSASKGKASRRCMRWNLLEKIVACAVLCSITGFSRAQSSAAVLGSVPSGPAGPEVLRLSFRDAINMAVRYNLGQIESGENSRIARGQRLHALSALLPQVNAGVAENVEQFSAATLGIKLPQVPS